MARITVEDCLAKVGSESRFSLIHLAIKRLKQHREGQPFLSDGSNKEVVMTLREIAAGHVTPDNIEELEKLTQATAAATAPVAEPLEEEPASAEPDLD